MTAKKSARKYLETNAGESHNSDNLVMEAMADADHHAPTTSLYKVNSNNQEEENEDFDENNSSTSTILPKDDENNFDSEHAQAQNKGITNASTKRVSKFWA